MVSSGRIMGPMGPMGPGPMGPGPMGNKSFGSPYAAPLPGESIFRIPTFDPPPTTAAATTTAAAAEHTQPAQPPANMRRDQISRKGIPPHSDLTQGP